MTRPAPTPSVVERHTKASWKCVAGSFRHDDMQPGEVAYFVETANEISAANCRLISAAPELLEALRLMRREYGDHADTADTLEAVRLADAAILKAQGGRS